MNTIRTTRPLLLLAASWFLLLPTSRCHAQGSLTPPPGVPAATMKTLDQLEPRTPVNATTCPGDAASLYKITQPGSYYLTGNITGVDPIKTGIAITSANVTLDMNGFTLTAAAGATNGDGINASRENIIITNGTVSGWYRFGIEGYSNTGGRYTNLTLRGNGYLQPNGGAIGSGLSAASATVSHCSFLNNKASGLMTSPGVTVSHCGAHGNAGTGFSLNNGCTASDCTARANGTGFSLGTGSSATGCSAYGNTNFGIVSQGTLTNCGTYSNAGGGIQLSGGGRASHCTANENGSSGAGSGFEGGGRCALDNCTANLNQEHGIVCGSDARVANCSAMTNGLVGIFVTDGGLVTGCVANRNQSDGIKVQDNSIVRDCVASRNGTNAVGIGIHATGSGNRIENNQAQYNPGYGIKCDSGPTHDYVLNNSAGANGVNYSPSTGATFAPIQSPATQTNPSANR